MDEKHLLCKKCKHYFGGNLANYLLARLDRLSCFLVAMDGETSAWN